MISPILTSPARNGCGIGHSPRQGGRRCKNKSARLEPFAEKSEVKPAPLAGDTFIKSSFARRLYRTMRPCLRDAPIAILQEGSIKTSEKCCGCSALNTNAADAPLGDRSMPLTRWAHYRQTRAQKKKALHLLALSGVVRPSTIELRYTASRFPIIDEPLLFVQNAYASASSTLPIRPAKTTLLTQHLYSTASRLLAKSKRHIQSFQWDIRKAA